MPKEKKQPSAAMYVWDGTLIAQGINHIDIIKWLRENAKKWAFQREIGGTTGYNHFQIRISLAVKKRKMELVKECKGTCMELTSWSLTSTPGTKGFNYVMKDLTRAEGPWTDKQVVHDMTVDAQKVLTTPRPWQVKVEEMIDNYVSDIYIHVIIDVFGTSGKSSFAKAMRIKGKAIRIPPLNDGTKLAGFVTTIGKSKCYCIDVTRPQDWKSQKELWTGIEQLKAGHIADWRYSAKELIMDPPMIIILTNTMPKTDVMSSGRIVFHLLKDNDLKQFSMARYVEQEHFYKLHKEENTRNKMNVTTDSW